MIVTVVSLVIIINATTIIVAIILMVETAIVNCFVTGSMG